VKRDVCGGGAPPAPTKPRSQRPRTLFGLGVEISCAAANMALDFPYLRVRFCCENRHRHPDDLFRLAKARASLSGISLRQFVTDTLRMQLEHENKRAQSTDPLWMTGFGGLADLGSETARIRDLIEDEFRSMTRGLPRSPGTEDCLSSPVTPISTRYRG